MRALDYCTMLHLEKSLEVAYQLASRSHLIKLAERIELIRQDKKNQMDMFEPFRTSVTNFNGPTKSAVHEDILPSGIAETSFSRKFQYTRYLQEPSCRVEHLADHFPRYRKLIIHLISFMCQRKNLVLKPYDLLHPFNVP